MNFILTSGGSGGSAGFGAGGPDASRDALLEQFAAVLRRLGEVARADSPAIGMSRARRRSGAIHLCFALPHELPPESAGETIVVFGHGLSACPPLPFAGDMATDWRTRLASSGGAICLSTHAAQAVRDLMGAGYPVRAVPPPLTPRLLARPQPGTLVVTGCVLDTASWPETGPPRRDVASETDATEAAWPTADEAATAAGAAPGSFRKTWRYRLGIVRLHAAYIYTEAFRDLLPAFLSRLASAAGRFVLRGFRRLLGMPAVDSQAMMGEACGPAHGLPGESAEEFPCWRAGHHEVKLGGGLVFAAEQGGWDRGWSDILSAFVITCRDDADTTLVVKTAELDESTRAGFAAYLRRLGPFACRVLILDGSIEGGLDPLIDAASFYLCANPVEAAPLPLMRFMAAGRPAVSPDHSALGDFVSPETSIVVASGIDYEPWPGDVEQTLAATGWRLDWGSLCNGIEAARAMAGCPEAYASHARQAARRMDELCSAEAASAALAQFFAEAAKWRHFTPQAAGPLATPRDRAELAA